MAQGVGMVAFGRPDGADPASRVLVHAVRAGAEGRHVSSSGEEEFHSMDHGAIDWRDVLDSTHWLVNSSDSALEGEPPRLAWAAAMTFAELEGSKTVMVVSNPPNPDLIDQSWGAVVGKIRQIHVMFLDSEVLGPISGIEGVDKDGLLREIRLKGMVPIVCTYDPVTGLARVEHSTGSVKESVARGLSPAEWLSGFLCRLPETGPGEEGIRRATAPE